MRMYVPTCAVRPQHEARAFTADLFREPQGPSRLQKHNRRGGAKPPNHEPQSQGPSRLVSDAPRLIRPPSFTNKYKKCGDPAEARSPPSPTFWQRRWPRHRSTKVRSNEAVTLDDAAYTKHIMRVQQLLGPKCSSWRRSKFSVMPM